MSHTDLILIITIIGFPSTVGGIYLIVKKINQYIPTPQNVLTRRGDIELNNFNEPTQFADAYFPKGRSDFSSTQFSDEN
jgi:hypothetical protein